jgi:hypothetical protein
MQKEWHTATKPLSEQIQYLAVQNRKFYKPDVQNYLKICRFFISVDWIWTRMDPHWSGSVLRSIAGSGSSFRPVRIHNIDFYDRIRQNDAKGFYVRYEVGHKCTVLTGIF